MASCTSASSIKRSFKYDVFLSFRGEDTRKNFVDHLYHALQQRGINTYKDDEEIKKGKRVSEELITSIEDSKIFIIVFSKNYASSSWCLEELVKIMERQKTNEQIAYPVFYDVQPNEVRNQSGAVGEAFNKHVNEEAVGRWRDALEEAAGLAGRVLKNTFDGHEAKFIQKIVQEISLELRFINPSIDEKLVGMETRVKDVVSSLELDVDDVRLIGIKGMGGAGKTTLARAVFDQISFQFEGSSFVENVREVSKGSLCGLRSLQKQVLSDVLDTQDITLNGVYEGKHMMKQRMCSRKILVILDDVDHVHQLKALAGGLNWFKPGSRVIITTREEQVLIAHGVPKKLILNVNLLSYEESICLFSRHAFGTQIPIQGYEDLSEQVICYAAGLPLTIRVLGSDLCGKDELEWTDALERLKTIPWKETLEILELSYESLEEEYKKVFLDVACILKGWDKEEAVRALECRGLHARIGLKVLELKSLVTVTNDGCLDMHDQIEEMGKDIVRRLHPDGPSRHSRLWKHDEIEDIFIEDKGTEETRCIKVRHVDPVIVMKGLRKMKELRFLDVMLEDEVFSSDYNDIGEDSLYLPNGLQYLRWDGYPFRCLPKKFQGTNLAGFKMDFSNINQLFQVGERKVLKKLRFIDLSYCKMLRSLDIGVIPNLERLSLEACHRLEELHMHVQNSKLRYLKLYKTELRTIDLERAQNLETIKLDVCYYLTELRMPDASVKLKHFTLFICPMLKTLNITRYQNLETLDMECNDFVELHFPTEKLKRLKLISSNMKTLNLTQSRKLEALDLLSCEDLVEIQMPIESPRLETIDVSITKLRTLNLIGAQNLKALYLIRCKDLVELHMPIEIPMLETINIRLSKLRTLNLMRTLNLKRLDLEQCEHLVELHMPTESLELKTITVHCSKLRTLNLTRTQNLESLDLEQCEHLVELHMPIESPELKTITAHCSKLRTLNLTGTQNLESLDLEQCENLVELHMPIECLELKTIKVRCSKLRTLNLTGARNLERLDLEQCEDLVELHMPIESPELKTINVRCSKLITFNLMGARNLESLDLEQCEDLVELHIPNETLRKLLLSWAV